MGAYLLLTYLKSKVVTILYVNESVLRQVGLVRWLNSQAQEGRHPAEVEIDLSRFTRWSLGRPLATVALLLRAASPRREWIEDAVRPVGPRRHGAPRVVVKVEGRAVL